MSLVLLALRAFDDRLGHVVDTKSVGSPVGALPHGLQEEAGHRAETRRDDLGLQADFDELRVRAEAGDGENRGVVIEDSKDGRDVGGNGAIAHVLELPAVRSIGLDANHSLTGTPEHEARRRRNGGAWTVQVGRAVFRERVRLDVADEPRGIAAGRCGGARERATREHHHSRVGYRSSVSGGVGVSVPDSMSPGMRWTHQTSTHPKQFRVLKTQVHVFTRRGRATRNSFGCDGRVTLVPHRRARRGHLLRSS